MRRDLLPCLEGLVYLRNEKLRNETKEMEQTTRTRTDQLAVFASELPLFQQPTAICDDLRILRVMNAVASRAATPDRVRGVVQDRIATMSAMLRSGKVETAMLFRVFLMTHATNALPLPDDVLMMEELLTNTRTRRAGHPIGERGRLEDIAALAAGKPSAGVCQVCMLLAGYGGSAGVRKAARQAALGIGGGTTQERMDELFIKALIRPEEYAPLDFEYYRASAETERWRTRAAAVYYVSEDPDRKRLAERLRLAHVRLSDLDIAELRRAGLAEDFIETFNQP